MPHPAQVEREPARVKTATGRTQGGLEELDDAIKAAGGQATLAPFDLADFDAARLGADGANWMPRYVERTRLEDRNAAEAEGVEVGDRALHPVPGPGEDRNGRNRGGSPATGRAAPGPRTG